MSLVSKLSAVAVATTMCAASFAGGPAPMVNNHNGVGVTMGLGDGVRGTQFQTGVMYAQDMFKAGLFVAAQSTNVTQAGPSDTNTWAIPVSLTLGVRHGLSDNLYGTLSAVGSYVFVTNKSSSNVKNPWALGFAIGADYYLSDSFYLTGYVTPFLYGTQKVSATDPKSFKSYSIFSSGYLGLTYNFNL